VFWLILSVLALAGGAAMLQRRRAYESPDAEPWRRSLGEDEPLDLEAIRRAEEEFLAAEESGWSEDDEADGDEPWR
jgi:hypothetical protein